jgi:hypothetical protein
MLIAEVQGPGAKCSTGQRRPNYKTKQKRKEKEVLQQYTATREERERDTKEPNYQRKS